MENKDYENLWDCIGKENQRGIDKEERTLSNVIDMMAERERDEKMEIKEVKELLEKKGLVRSFTDLVMALDESDANSNELWMTVWKDGRVTLSLTQRGHDYPPETYRAIKEVIHFPRVCIYDDFDISGALEDGTSEDGLQDVAMDSFRENFDLDEYLNKYMEE